MTSINIDPPQTITNTGLLSPNKFKIVLARYPNVNFFAQRVIIPDASIQGVLKYTGKFADYKVIGDKIEFGDLVISFILDEDMATLFELIDWMYRALNTELDSATRTDIKIMTLSNNLNKNKVITCHNCFPSTTGSVLLDATVSEDSPLSVDVSFKMSHFTISDQ